MTNVSSIAIEQQSSRGTFSSIAIHGGGVMLLVHKDISHMPITELENDSESIWVKVFANKTSNFVASWYRPPGSTSEEFQLLREQSDYIRVKSYPQSMS